MARTNANMFSEKSSRISPGRPWHESALFRPLVGHPGSVMFPPYSRVSTQTEQTNTQVQWEGALHFARSHQREETWRARQTKRSAYRVPTCECSETEFSVSHGTHRLQGEHRPTSPTEPTSSNHVETSAGFQHAEVFLAALSARFILVRRK